MVSRFMTLEGKRAIFLYSMFEFGSIICIPSWALQFPLGTRIRMIGKLESINTQSRTLVLSYKSSSMIVDYSLVDQFQDFIGEVYEVYGMIEEKRRTMNNEKFIYCSALLVDVVQGADMKLIEETLLIFNKTAHPEYKTIFI